MTATTQNSYNNNEVHTSDLRQFKKCRVAWNFSSPVRHNWIPRRTNPYFIRGRAWHVAFEYYNTGRDIHVGLDAGLDEELEKARLNRASYDMAEINQMREDGHQILKMYPGWVKSHLSDLRLFDGAVEQTASIQLVPGKTNFAYRSDWLAANDYGYWVVDYKTVQQLPSSYDYLDYDEQVSGYMKAAQLTHGIRFTGVIYIFCIVKPPTKPAQLKNGGISVREDSWCTPQLFYDTCLEYGLNPSKYKEHIQRLAQRNQWFHRVDIIKTQHQLDWTWDMHKRVTEEMVNPDVLIYPSPDRMNCTQCAFKTPCLLYMQGSDPTDVLRAEYVQGEYR